MVATCVQRWFISKDPPKGCEICSKGGLGAGVGGKVDEIDEKGRRNKVQTFKLYGKTIAYFQINQTSKICNCAFIEN